MKVLLLSHNPVTTYNNMGKTFLSLFSAFRPEELCQLFLYPAVPDTACCGSYYRFTDREALSAGRSAQIRRAMTNSPAKKRSEPIVRPAAAPSPCVWPAISSGSSAAGIIPA